MNNDNHQHHKTLLNMAGAQFGVDCATTWQTLEQSVTAYAKVLHLQQGGSSRENSEGAAFNAWWQSCCELLAPRQVSISRVRFAPNDAPNNVQSNMSNNTANNTASNTASNRAINRASNEEDEYIEIFNAGPLIVDLSGWRLHASREGRGVRFPVGTLIKPQLKLRIYTHKKGAFSFNSERSIWHYQGDKASLFNRSGVLISSWLYGVNAHEQVTINQLHFDQSVFDQSVFDQSSFDQSEFDPLGFDLQANSINPEEYADISNNSSSWIDVSNWRLSTGKDQCYIFPPNSTLSPKARLTIDLNAQDTERCGYLFKSHRSKWNYKLDSGVLTDYMGKTVSSYCYGENSTFFGPKKRGGIINRPLEALTARKSVV